MRGRGGVEGVNVRGKREDRVHISGVIDSR